MNIATFYSGLLIKTRNLKKLREKVLAPKELGDRETLIGPTLAQIESISILQEF